MRTMVGTAFVVLAIGSAAGLSGCKKADAATAGLWPFSGATRQGRYAGVGIYTPNVAWTKMATDPSLRPASAATLNDDEAIIVVTDSQTGEVRACGDLSGNCIGMNPWQAGLAKSQVAPVNVTQHGNPTGGADVNAAAIDANAAEASAQAAERAR